MLYDLSVTQIYDRNAVVEGLNELLETFNERFFNDDVGLFLSNDDGMRTMSRLQAFVKRGHANDLLNVLNDLVVRYAFNAERKSPGGFDICIRLVRETFLNETNTTLSKALKKRFEGGCAVQSNNPIDDDITWLLETFCKRDDLKKMTRHALQLAGFGGKVTIEKSTSDVQSIELIDGNLFKCKPAMEIKAKRIKHPLVILVDGFIESVAEINRLLTQAAETKEPLFLFFRGASPDVINTLKVNMMRGMLNVYPYQVDFDIDGANELVDIAVVCSTDVVSSLKGQLITTLGLVDCVRVEEAVIYADGVLFRNKLARHNVNIHLAELKERREHVDGFLGDTLDKRIRALSSRNVIIRLSDDVDFMVKSQILDRTLRAYASLLDHGTMVVSDNRFLTGSILAAVKNHELCVKMLNELGVVVIDRF